MKTEYTQTILVPNRIAIDINQYLQAIYPSEYQGKDNILSFSTRFPDNMRMDIRCHGRDDGPSWADAILFDETETEICHSPKSDEFFDIWTFVENKTRYNVIVKIQQ